MKNLVQKQKMRVAGLCLAIGMSVVAVNAQTTVTTGAGAGAKNSAKTNTTGTASVRVVDNKGTIKYLQANNGLTQIVNTTNDVTTTTWQLGGTLTDNTYIDVNGKAFALDGIELATTLAASTDASDKSIHGGTTSGFTLLVRDESTGAVKKLLVSDLVKGGQTTVTVSADAADATYTNVALSSDINKISVYRNGVKLLVADNYTLAQATDPLVGPTLKILGTVGTAAAGGVPESDDYYALTTTDKIEVQWIK